MCCAILSCQLIDKERNKRSKFADNPYIQKDLYKNCIAPCMHAHKVIGFHLISLIGERAKRVSHSQVCPIENRDIYIYCAYVVFAL